MKKLSITSIANDLQEWLFNAVTSNNLVYNSCWEDPRLDRKMLQLDRQSRVVMLTSAGCNALDYLLDGPRLIHCVDLNPAQNALMELKQSLFKNGNFPLLWDFFGKGKIESASIVYRQDLRHFLSPSSRRYWDNHIDYFIPSPTQPSFYFNGTSGKVALMIYKRIQRKGLSSRIRKLLDAQTIKEQIYYFKEIEPLLWNGFHKWLAGQHALTSMLGVPATQRNIIAQKYDGGLFDFIQQSLRRVFTGRPIHDNYFWRVYLTGSYRRDCCPNYLREDYFQLLCKREHKIKTHTLTLLQFLRNHPGTYTHFVLLDHQDWMANSKPDLLASEWRHILANSKAGTRIVFRSAGASIDFLPAFVRDRVDFHPGLTNSLQAGDRVGTYESTHLGLVQ